MEPDLLTDEERKERESTWIVTCPHCGSGHGVRVDDSDLQATIAEQAATIERFRELAEAEDCFSGPGWWLDKEGQPKSSKNYAYRRLVNARAAITAADMGEADNGHDTPISPVLGNWAADDYQVPDQRFPDTEKAE